VLMLSCKVDLCKTLALGETHRTRCGEVEMVSEQVSHHPPITCWELVGPGR